MTKVHMNIRIVCLIHTESIHHEIFFLSNGKWQMAFVMSMWFRNIFDLTRYIPMDLTTKKKRSRKECVITIHDFNLFAHHQDITVAIMIICFLQLTLKIATRRPQQMTQRSPFGEMIAIEPYIFAPDYIWAACFGNDSHAMQE